MFSYYKQISMNICREIDLLYKLRFDGAGVASFGIFE
jgi:hypothetical protein